MYDVGKALLKFALRWLLPSFILLIFPNILPEGNQLKQIIFYPFTLTFYVLTLATTVIIILSIIFTRIYLRKKYIDLALDNYTDELTGLKNYKALADYMREKLLEVQYSSKTFSAILIDVDDFKEFNTRVGYNTSDRVLAKLGELLGNDKRATDETFRFFLRGDEFIIITNDTSLNDALKASERKRKLIENTKFSVDGKSFDLTVSCGVTEFKTGDTFESFIERVNAALLLAKKVDGKNNSISII